MENTIFLFLFAIIITPSSSKAERFDESTFPGFTSNKIDHSTLLSMNRHANELIIHYKTLAIIATNSFITFRNLKSLSIYKNRITDLQQGIFNGLNQLRTLEIIDGSMLTTLNRNIFHNLQNLTTLYLSMNNLKYLEIGTFNGLEKLNLLDLSRNNITHLTIGIFDGLTELETLDLRDNNLENLESGIFDPLESLADLNLSYNNLRYLVPGVLGSPVDDISSNRTNFIKSVRTSLKFFKIRRNHITHIGYKTFNRMNLNLLDLDHNQIIRIEKESFYGLSVNELNLDYNKIAVIKSGTFDGVINIGQLSISKNPIGRIENNTFLPVQSLKTIYTSIPDFRIYAEASVWGISNSTKIMKHALLKNDEDKIKRNELI